jgi:hypothetical protein
MGMPNTGAFARVKEWNDVNSGLRLANASRLVDPIRTAMVGLDEATANDYVRVLQIPRSGMTMPGTKERRDRVRALLLIQLLTHETTTADAPTVRAALLSKSDTDLNASILSKGAGIGSSSASVQTEPTAQSTTRLPSAPEVAPAAATLVPPPVKKLAIPKAVADLYGRRATINSNFASIVRSDRDKSLLLEKLNNVFGDEFRTQLTLELSNYRSSISGMAEGVDTAYEAFNKAMAKDAQQEKKKYDIAISIIKTGLAAVGAGPLVSIGAAIVGELAEHAYAGLSGMISSNTLKSGATSGINATVDAVGAMVQFSHGQQDLWATAIRVQNMQSVNQSVIAKAASGLKKALTDRRMSLDGVPGSANLKVTLLERYDMVVLDMITHLNRAFVMSLTGSHEATFGAVLGSARDHSTVRDLSGRSQTNPYQLADIFLDHVLSTRPDLMARHGGGIAVFDTYLNDVRRQVFEDWRRLFPPVKPIEAAQAQSFAKLCEAKMWCRVIVNEQRQGRKPRDAVIERLDAVGLIGRWSQSGLGMLRISRSKDDNERLRIYQQGRLRYHGSNWEVAELQKLALWVDDDRNVNIPALAAGIVEGGISGVWDKVRSYNMRVTEERERLEGGSLSRLGVVA